MSEHCFLLDIIYLLLLVSLAVALVFFVAFVVAVMRGQFDDMKTPAIRLLFDSDKQPQGTNDVENTQTHQNTSE